MFILFYQQASAEVREAGKRAVVQIQTKNPGFIASTSSIAPPFLKTLLKATSLSANESVVVVSKSNEKSSAMSVNNGTSPSSTKENAKKELTILHYNDVRILLN